MPASLSTSSGPTAPVEANRPCLTTRIKLPICARTPRTEHAYRMSPDDRRQAHPIGTYALVALDAQNAGSGARTKEDRRVVLCALRRPGRGLPAWSLDEEKSRPLFKQA